ncbi:MAG TPA: hypothetical protein VE662_05340 [Solirubrobacterales bacterium]|nr:hypothetical protein [Solirubrobacterales bacterium]
MRKPSAQDFVAKLYRDLRDRRSRSRAIRKPAPPRFVMDLYRDLRDRRLLLPAAVLAVALIAVPIALSSSSTPISTPIAPAGAPGGGETRSAAEPAVAMQELGVTNYRKRLQQLKSKDPFHQQFLPRTATSKLQTSLTTASSGSTTDSGGASGGSTSGPASSTVGGSTSTSNPSTGASTGTSTESASSSSHTSPKPPKPRWFSYRLAVKVGPVGELEELSSVKRLTMLPSESKAVITFVGVSEDGKRALFLVSPDVDSVSGDGRCVPSSSSCQYVVLKQGEEATFDFAPDGKTYKLKLLEIRLSSISGDGSGGGHKLQPGDPDALFGSG